MKVKFTKFHTEAVTPVRANATDAGLDLVAVSNGAIRQTYIEYDTGIALEIPEGHVGLLFPRSSVSNKDLTLCNSVGVIDSSYRGTLKVRFKDHRPLKNGHEGLYKKGDKIAQLMILPYPQVELVEANVLSETARGEGGFGSTDKPVKKTRKKVAKNVSDSVVDNQ